MEGGSEENFYPPDHVIKVIDYNQNTSRNKQHKKVLCSVLEKILANLGVIAELKVGDKLDMIPTGYFIIQGPTWYFTAVRFIKKLDRWQTYNQLLDVVGTAESIISGDVNATDSRVKEALINSVHGLKNLKETYNQDVTMKINLNVLIERICINYGFNDGDIVGI